MKQALKTVENLVELVYQEVQRIKAHKDVTDRSYELLREASADVINLKRKLELARAYMDIGQQEKV